MSSRLFISSGAVALTGLMFDGSMRPVALVIDIAIISGIGMFLIMGRMTMQKEGIIKG